jgi:RND family efflux transporter MFP subunit
MDQTAKPRPAAHARRVSSQRWKVVLVALLATAVLLLVGIVPRVRAREGVRRDTAALAVPVVSVLHVERSTADHDVVLPASVRGELDAPIFARASGYLARWYFDIGARVKKGALLAEIEAPEVDQQLLQARADLSTALANLQLSRLTARRYAGLRESGVVSAQDVDNTAGDFAAKTALVRSSQANVHRLQELQSYEKVYAPFDGVITARNTDVGALIDSGATGGANAELFHISQPDKLRVYVNVPEIYAPAAKLGMPVDLTLAAYPGQHFPGQLVRTASAIDPTTHTLVAEIGVDNASGVLLPGAFARVHFKLGDATPAFLVPVSALMFRAEGLRVAVVSRDDTIALTPISIGRDLGTVVEVTSGLQGDEAIVAEPPDSLLQGQGVRLADDAAGAPGAAP